MQGRKSSRRKHRRQSRRLCDSHRTAEPTENAVFTRLLGDLAIEKSVGQGVCQKTGIDIKSVCYGTRKAR